MAATPIIKHKKENLFRGEMFKLACTELIGVSKSYFTISPPL